jgi:hypothetical protein
LPSLVKNLEPLTEMVGMALTAVKPAMAAKAVVKRTMVEYAVFPT